MDGEILVRKWTIGAKRKLAKEHLKKQASKMLRLSNSKFAPASVGDNVKVPVPEVDRSKCSKINIIGIIMEVDSEKSTVQNWYHRRSVTRFVLPRSV